MKQTEKDTLQAYNILSEGTMVKGSLQSEGSLRIDGKFEGELTLKGKLVIGKKGVVTGTVVCSSADIEGELTIEKMKVAGLLSIKESARIQGTIEADRLYIEQGAVFNGQCVMPQQRQS